MLFSIMGIDAIIEINNLYFILEVKEELEEVRS